MTGAATFLLFLLLLAGYLARILWRRQDAGAARPAAVLVLLIAGWGLGYLFELLAVTLQAKVFWASMQYLCIAFLPVAWLVLALRISGVSRLSSLRALVAASAFPFAMQPIIWTNDAHRWVWRTLDLTTEGPFLLLEIEYGPLFWVFNGYSLALVLLGSITFIYAATTREVLSTPQRVVLIAIPVVPAVANVVYTTRAGPLAHLDLTPFAFLLSCLLLFVAFLHFRIDRIDLSRMQGGQKARMEMALHAAGADAYYWDNSRTDYIVDDRELDLLGGARASVSVSHADLMRIVHPEDRQQFTDNCIRALRGLDTLETECRIVDWRGNARRIRLYGSMQRDDHGRVVLSSGLVQDVTRQYEAENALRAARQDVESINTDLRKEIAARRKAENRLKEHQAHLESNIRERTQELVSLTRRLNALLNSTAEGILGIDKDDTVTFCNSMALGILGLSSESNLLGRPISTIGFHFDHDAWGQKASELGGNLPVDTVSVTRPDGHERLVDFRSYPIIREGRLEGGVITFLDITEAEQAKRRAQSEAELANRILETSAAPIWSLDRDGNIVLINSAACRMLECRQDEVLGSCWFDLFVRDERRERVREQYNRRMHGARIEPQDGTTELRSSMGKTLHIRCRVATLYGDDGTPFGVLSSAEDRTDLMAIEFQLEQAQRTHVLGQLSGGVAHDFNNLLQVIYGNAELLQTDCPDRDELIATILDAAEKGSALTHRLLAYASNQPLEPEFVEFPDFLESTKSLLQSTLPENIAIRVERCSLACTAYVDRGQLENTLLNLCINARDAMPRGGTLTLGCGLIDLDAAQTAPIVEPGRFVRLTVADTGVGIEPESLPHIFEPFFTTKALGDGTGLGLSTVYGFARQSGGFVSVDTKPGQGSKFHLNLPACGAPELQDTHPATEENPSATGLRLLVLEDNESVRRMILSMLGRLEHEAVGVKDVPSARAALSGSDHFDMLLSDIILSDAIDGVEFAEEARGLRPGLPVLLVSGYSREAPDTVRKHALNGAVLHKPFTLDQLADAIRNTLHGRRDRIDTPPGA